MEPLSLTCPHCSKSWKQFKAGAGHVVCPYCKAVVIEAESPAVAVPVPQLAESDDLIEPEGN